MNLTNCQLSQQRNRCTSFSFFVNVFVNLKFNFRPYSDFIFGGRNRRPKAENFRFRPKVSAFGRPLNSLPEKNLPWGTKGKFLKKKFFWKNLVWPFWPVRNANRKNGLAFYSTPWEPRNPHPVYNLGSSWSSPFDDYSGFQQTPGMPILLQHSVYVEASLSNWLVCRLTS